MPPLFRKIYTPYNGNIVYFQKEDTVMFWMVLYMLVSIIMSVVLSSITFKVTDLSDFGSCTKTTFLIYFVVGNLLAWPVFMIFAASAYLHDEISI